MYPVIGGPFGRPCSHAIVRVAESSAGPGPLAAIDGAGSAGGVPADCIVTDGPNGPAPSSFHACTCTDCSASLSSPVTVVCRDDAATSTVRLCPVDDDRRTTYLRSALPSFSGVSHAMVRLPSPRVTIRTPVTARGRVSGRTVLLGALGGLWPTPFTATTVKV